jgi:hypothetical protein
MSRCHSSCMHTSSSKVRGSDDVNSNKRGRQGCALANPTRGKSSELVYNFPIEAPFLVMFFDAYSAGKHTSFEGSEGYLIGCCRMCSLPAWSQSPEPRQPLLPLLSCTSYFDTDFATQLSWIKTAIFGVCREAIDLLKINCHIPSSANHNPMIIERINRYHTKGLKIMCNERDSVRVALEAILLLLYAWNSCPVPGTNISRSLVAVGREFAFPIDFSSGKHWELTSSPSTVVSYSKELATCVSACRQVAELLA